MKKQPFVKRLQFAWAGLRTTYVSEASFRVQTRFFLVGIGLLVMLRPAPIWWAVMFLSMAGVLASELINTALEALADRVHPELHAAIGYAKDCAAGAVLVMSGCSLAVGAALIIDRWQWIVACFSG